MTSDIILVLLLHDQIERYIKYSNPSFYFFLIDREES